jgi:hypothetical protein
MRRTLASAALLGGLTLGGLGVTAAPALASTTDASVVLAADTSDENSGDDTGKWGLAGLAGMLGLFGYKKYKDHRAASGTRIGGVDTDGSGSRRV